MDVKVPEAPLSPIIRRKSTARKYRKTKNKLLNIVETESTENYVSRENKKYQNVVTFEESLLKSFSEAPFEGFINDELTHYSKLLCQIQNITRKHFPQNQNVFKGFSSYEINECVQLLNTYYENNVLLKEKLYTSREQHKLIKIQKGIITNATSTNSDIHEIETNNKFKELNNVLEENDINNLENCGVRLENKTYLNNSHDVHNELSNMNVICKENVADYKSDKLNQIYTSSSKKTVPITMIKHVKNSDESDNIQTKFLGFTSASGKIIQTTEKSVEYVKKLLLNDKYNKQFVNIESTGNDFKNTFSEIESSKSKITQKTPKYDQTNVVQTSSKSLENCKILNNSEIEQIENLHNTAHNFNTKSEQIQCYKGFIHASGKNVKISTETLEKANKLLENYLKDSDVQSDVENTPIPNIKKVVKDKNQKVEINKPELNLQILSNQSQFSSSSEKYSNTYVKTIEKDNVFLQNNSNNANLSKPYEFIEDCSQDLVCATTTGKDIYVSSKSLSLSGIKAELGSAIKIDNADEEIKESINEFHKNENVDIIEKEFTSLNKTNNNQCQFFGSFSTASGKVVKTSAESLNNAKMLLENDSIGIETSIKTLPYDKLSINESRNVTGKNLGKKNSSKFNTSLTNTSKIYFSQFDKNGNTENIECSSSFKTPDKNTLKKRLGISSCKQIQISNANLENAKSIFNDKCSSVSQKKEIVTFTSTPIKSGPSFYLTNSPDVKPFNVSDQNITPIKLKSSHALFENLHENTCSNSYIFQTPANIGVQDFEEKIKVFTERMNMIRFQENNCGCKSEKEKLPNPGVLFKKKNTSSKISLKNFVKDSRPGNVYNDKFKLFAITPDNAEKLHFILDDENLIFKQTLDGCVIVPNTNNNIGLIEIARGFKSMIGINENLIHKLWIKNHYKWIVWKLGSYERMFPKYFSNCLNVENIVAQLKYRYDREIDKTERSALRKIYEKDDVPQKRLILCVSNIFRVRNNLYELELTDGWYSIRCIIDELLSEQIAKKRIQIGTKLITCNAELINCDNGCHPLDATDLVRLKINFNCTKRAAWYTKLGYQQNPSPLIVNLSFSHPSGGIISGIKVYIARVYPIRYYERTGGIQVWRNSKAEKYESQKWDIQSSKSIEEISALVHKEFEEREKSRDSNICTTEMKHITNISNIHCAKTLYELLCNSNDVHYIEQQLNASQKEAIRNYQETMFYKKQKEIESAICEHVTKKNILKRDVSPLLQLAVFDINDLNPKKQNLSIWRPTEEQSQFFKEGTVLNIYNLILRCRENLSTTTKTFYKQEIKENLSKFNKYKRKFVPIASLESNIFTNDFKEFDTVGIVTHLKIMDNFQEIWLSDIIGRLLLITISIAPKYCILLDKLKKGQTVIVCNLTFIKKNLICIKASGNFNTLFSTYSQYKHLQEGLEMFEKLLPKNISGLLKSCEEKIVNYYLENKINQINIVPDENDPNNVEISDESTLVYDHMTSLDLALSSINIDQFI